MLSVYWCCSSSVLVEVSCVNFFGISKRQQWSLYISLCKKKLFWQKSGLFVDIIGLLIANRSIRCNPTLGLEASFCDKICLVGEGGSALLVISLRSASYVWPRVLQLNLQVDSFPSSQRTTTLISMVPVQVHLHTSVEEWPAPFLHILSSKSCHLVIDCSCSDKCKVESQSTFNLPFLYV